MKSDEEIFNLAKQLHLSGKITEAQKLYLKKGTNEKSQNYGKTKEIVQEYIELIKNEL